MRLEELNMKKNMKNKLFNVLFRKVFAEEVQATATETNPTEGEVANQQTTKQTGESNTTTPQISFEQLVAQARSEEKKKLYPEIERLKKESNDKTVKINELMLALGAKETTISELQAKLKEAQSGQISSKELDEAKAVIAKLSSELEAEKNKVIQMELESYKKEKLAEAGQEIIPDLVHGSTKEEIDQTVELAKQRYTDIFGSIANQTKQNQPTKDFNRAMAGGGIVNPASPFSTSTSVEDINNLDLRTAEGKKKYEELRKQMNL